MCAKQITNLAFKGGGVKGTAYVGAVVVLEQQGILKNVTKVAGTSAGSIMAGLLALKYSAQEIFDKVFSMDMPKLEDDKHDLQVLKRYGLYAGDYFLDWMTDAVNNSPVFKGKNIEPTLKNLADNGGLELHCFTCDINNHNLVTLSPEKTPDVLVAEAVRSSMSIPLFFKAFQFSQGLPKDNLHVDGGMLYNYPINAFDEGIDNANPATLGFYLGLENKFPKPVEFGYGHIMKYIKNTFATFLQAQHVHFIQHPKDVARTVFIDDFGEPPVDFQISDQMKTLLYQSGYKSCWEYLHEHSMLTDLKTTNPYEEWIKGVTS